MIKKSLLVAVLLVALCVLCLAPVANAARPQQARAEFELSFEGFEPAHGTFENGPSFCLTGTFTALGVGGEPKETATHLIGQDQIRFECDDGGDFTVVARHVIDLEAEHVSGTWRVIDQSGLGERLIGAGSHESVGGYLNEAWTGRLILFG